MASASRDQLSNGTSHSFHLLWELQRDKPQPALGVMLFSGFLAGKARIEIAGVSGSNQRRMSASVTAFAPYSRCLGISFSTSWLFQGRTNLGDFAIQLIQPLGEDRFVLANMGSSEVLRAMLLSVMCGTVLHGNVALPGTLPVGSVSHVPFGLRATSSAFNGRSRR